MTKIIIAFAGRKQSGKTTAANLLLPHGFVRCSFAEPIKAMLAQLMTIASLTPDEIVRYMGEDKETLIPALGASTRYLLQTLGTEWGRQGIHADIWVNITRSRLERLDAEYVVFDDLRFDNEADLIRSLGGLVVHVVRDPQATFYPDAHSSEKGIVQHEDDAYLDNTGSLLRFTARAETLVADFWEVADKIEAVPLPEAIYNAYRATFKTIKLNKKPAATSTDGNSETDEE